MDAPQVHAWLQNGCKMYANLWIAMHAPHMIGTRSMTYDYRTVLVPTGGAVSEGRGACQRISNIKKYFNYSELGLLSTTANSNPVLFRSATTRKLMWHCNFIISSHSSAFTAMTLSSPSSVACTPVTAHSRTRRSPTGVGARWASLASAAGASEQVLGAPLQSPRPTTTWYTPKSMSRGLKLWNYMVLHSGILKESTVDK